MAPAPYGCVAEKFEGLLTSLCILIALFCRAAVDVVGRFRYLSLPCSILLSNVRLGPELINRKDGGSCIF